MKKIIFSFLSIVLAMALSTEAFGVLPQPPLSTVLQQKENTDFEPTPDFDPEGRRDLTAPVFCVISMEEGVQFDSPVFGIISYEIWSADQTNCIGSYSYEFDFINHLFSLPEGDYTIVFKTYDTIYSGFVTL